MGSVSIAVGCAVGIPIGVGLLVAFFFWCRLQRRFKREEKEDEELDHVIHDDNGYISFDNLETLQQHQTHKEQAIWQNAEAPESNDSEIFEVRKISRQHIVGSGSSDGSVSQEEKNAHITGSQENIRPSNQQHQQREQEPKQEAQPSNNRKSKYFVPAYRRKINAMQSKTVHIDGPSPNGSSNTSLISSQKIPKKHINSYDQMIPVASSNLSPVDVNVEEKERSQSHENLIRNLHSQDYGSYPTRASSTSLTQLNTADASNSSLNSNARQGSSADNVFETPKSDRGLVSDEKLEKPEDVYLLKNNYDIANTNEIAEEDQYENEFTNYTENKREFINSLRPKKV